MLMGVLPGSVYAENLEGEVPADSETTVGEAPVDGEATVGEVPADGETTQTEAAETTAPAGLPDAEYQAVVNRMMSGWKFPLPEEWFGAIAAFAGSKDGDESTFYRVSEGGRDSLVVRASGGLEIYAPQGGTLYRSGYPDAQRGNVAVIEGNADNSYACYAIISNIGDSVPVSSGSPVQPGALIGYTGGGDVYITCLMDAAGQGEWIANNLSTSLSGIDWLTESYGRGLICVNPSAQTVSNYAGYVPAKFVGPITYEFVAPQPVVPTEPVTEPVTQPVTEPVTQPAAHEHTWDAGQVTQAASHTAEGQIVYTCSGCGEQRAEPIPMQAHVFDQSVVSDVCLAAPASCLSPAQYYYTCVCGAVGSETFTSGEVGGHIWDAGQVTQAASHTAEGQTIYTCTVCGEQRAETIPAGGDHVYDQSVVSDAYLATPATCQSPAQYYYTCVCGAVGTETFTSGETVEHTWNEGVVTVEPTHTAPGERTYTCTVCNQTRTEEIPVSSEHVFDQTVPDPQYLVSEATCTSPAQYVMSCACGEKGTETFPYGEAKGHGFVSAWSMDTENHWHAAACEHTDEKGDFGPHNWDDGTITVHAGHNTDGQKVYTCVVCGQQKTEVVPGQPHEYNQMIPDSKYLASAATCTSPATYYKSCTCGAAGTETFTDGQAKGHTFSNSWTSNDQQHWQAATCEHTGEKIKVGDHIWDPGIITVQPTAYSKGVKTYTCAVCGRTRTEELAPSNHVHTYSTAWAGNTTYHWHPATCEHTAEVNGVALHTWNTGVVTVWASHSAPGEKMFTCTVCGMTKKEAVPAEHSYTQQNPSNNYLKSAATCTSPAVYYRSCTCGAKGTETFTYGSALGHSFSGSWGKDENYHWSLCTRCNARGELAVHTYNQSNVCSVCGYSTAESHVHSSHLTRVPAKTATCTQPGNVAYYICSCGKWFSDPSTTAEITDQSSVVTQAVGHVDQNKDGRCDVCKERMATDTVQYEITEGAEATWLTSSNKGMVIRSSADYSKFDHVEVDGSTISSLNYTVTAGSTVVELSANYMKRLTVGHHSISIVSKDGTAKTGFTVKQGAATAGSSGGSSGWLIVIVIAILIAIAIPVGIGYYVYQNKTSGGKYSR